MGKHVVILSTIFEGRNTLFDNVLINNSFVGYGSYIQKNSNILYSSIGRYCSIADHVHTCLGVHPTNFLSTYPAFYYDTTKELGYSYHLGVPSCQIYKYPPNDNGYQIIIGNDVWIGSNVLILGGCEIGDGAIIAAGSVVTMSVPPYQIWGGVPAKFIRNRFDENVIIKLREIQWWNQSEEWIHANIGAFNEELTLNTLMTLK